MGFSARSLLRTRAGGFAVDRARDILVSAARAQDVAQTTARTRNLFARQGGDSGYHRLDLIVALMALSDAEKGENVALQLFARLLPRKPELNVADHALLKLLTTSPLSEALVLSDAQVIAASGALGASIAPLALAIHRGLDSIRVRVNPAGRSKIRDLAWLRKQGLTANEIALVERYEAQTYERLGIRRMPWSSLAACRREMESHLDSRDLMHGMGSFYQSCDELLIRGQRPTRSRFQTYGLARLLTPDDHVLDIGCNNGFFSLEVAKHAAHVDGFDISPKFIGVAETARRCLGVENCSFSVSDFASFTPTRLYDVVLSFAVHHWIGMPMTDYAERIRHLLRDDGHVLLESQDLTTHDSNWSQRLAEFMSAGFVMKDSGTLCDDGYLVRKFVLLRKIGRA